MAWTLCEHVSYCTASGAVLFLDTARDRYFRLPDSAAPAFRQWAAQGAPEPLPPALAMLEREQLLRRHPGPSHLPSPSRPKPLAAATAAQGWRGGSPHVLDVLGSYWKVRRRLRGGLQPALDRILPPARPTGFAPDLAGRFLWVRQRLPRRPLCLLDSLALLDFLHVQNAAAQIVFAVQAKPFTAHCWVEDRGVVLNDAVDVVAPFTPILVR